MNTDFEKAKEYAWQQTDWIAHRGAYYSPKDCVFFYHNDVQVYDPWLDLDGNPVTDPCQYYGEAKVIEFVRRIIARREGNANRIDQVEVDKKVLDFLKMLYFGVTDNPFEAASRSAYTDMCRTIRFCGKDSVALRKYVDNLLEERIPDLSTIQNSDEYNGWHFEICHKIVDAYTSAGVQLYVGQAQKWVNMTLKYLYVLVPDVIEPFYQYLHIPLDNYIIDIAKKQYGIKPLPCAWSRIENYHQYLDYEEKLMEVIDGNPLDWEFEKWLESARSQKQGKR
jgi:hypothetical protein